MTAPAWLWILFTVVGAAAQTARTAMQRELTETLGTIGATHVRFLFGFRSRSLSSASLPFFCPGRCPLRTRRR